jgi:hypothetical protein
MIANGESTVENLGGWQQTLPKTLSERAVRTIFPSR